jgi:hypothetical protein
MPWRVLSDRRAARARAAERLLLCALTVAFALLSHPAAAVPSFARQTGLPCAQCHVVAFGPALTEYGRQFKLNGYVFAKQNGGLNIPLAATVIAAYDSPSKPTPAPAPFSNRDNLVVQDASVFLAGRVTDHFGVFVKGNYDGIIKHAALDNTDLRYARTVELGGHSAVVGLDVNNDPTVQDLWSSTSIWSYPYVSSELAVTSPTTAQLLRGFLAQSVLGTSLYTMIDNHLYLEAGFYRGLSEKWLGDLGNARGSSHLSGAAPYLRATLQQQHGAHYFALGAIGFSAKQEPFPTTTQTDRFTDYGLDVTYQFTAAAQRAVDAHLSWLHEDRKLDASFATHTSDSTSNHLDTVMADVSYVISQTWVGSAGVFNTNGSANRRLLAPAPIGGSANGSPESRGYMVQLEYIPFGKAGSFASPWINLRLGVRYTGFLRFNGGSSNYDGFGRSASDNNSLFVFAWLGF